MWLSFSLLFHSSNEILAKPLNTQLLQDLLSHGTTLITLITLITRSQTKKHVCQKSCMFMSILWAVQNQDQDFHYNVNHIDNSNISNVSSSKEHVKDAKLWISRGPWWCYKRSFGSLRFVATCPSSFRKCEDQQHGPKTGWHQSGRAVESREILVSDIVQTCCRSS